MTIPHVAVAIPAFNEADGIGEFLREIDRALAPAAARVSLVVVDDASTDDTRAVLHALGAALDSDLMLETSPHNRGHGPTVRRAYDLALATGAAIVLQVDGDGQFLGTDLRRLLVLLEDGAPATCGVRRFRQDPWFRMLMTRLVRSYVGVGFGVPTRDANCPLRGYRAEVLAPLLERIPPEAMVPNLYLTILAARSGVTMVEVDVTHRVRRGTSAQGSTWGGPNITLAVPWRLVRFSALALRESAAFRTTVRHIGQPDASG